MMVAFIRNNALWTWNKSYFHWNMVWTWTMDILIQCWVRSCLHWKSLKWCLFDLFPSTLTLHLVRLNEKTPWKLCLCRKCVSTRKQYWLVHQMSPLKCQVTISIGCTMVAFIRKNAYTTWNNFTCSSCFIALQFELEQIQGSHFVDLLSMWKVIWKCYIYMPPLLGLTENMMAAGYFYPK